MHLREKHKIKQIEKIVGRPIERALIPTGKEVCEKQLFNHIDRIEHVDINREDIDDYLPVIFKKLEWMSREELITRMVALNFNRFLDYYRDAMDLNVSEKDEKKDKLERKKDRANRDEGLKRLYFGLGKNDHILPQKIIGKINDVTHTRDIRIGRIDLYDDFSYVDVEEAYIPMILECFADPRNNPKGIVVEVAKEQPKRDGKDAKKDGDRKERSGRKPREEEKKPRSERREEKERREDFREEEMFEEKSKKKAKSIDDDKPKFKVEKSRDGHEWLDPDWRNHLDDIDIFIDDDDKRPSRKKRNEERGFGAKKSSTKSTSKSSSRGSSSSRSYSKSSSRDNASSGRGRRGAARNAEPNYYAPKHHGGRRGR